MSAAHRDPWVLLGVSRQADDKEIKSAYRKLALKYHPDRNRGNAEAEAMFQDIARAYEAIATEETRSLWLAEYEGERHADGSFRADDFPDLSAEPPPSASPPASVPIRQEIRKAVTLDFRQSFEGAQVQLDIEVEDSCTVCGGSGAAPGHEPRSCAICGGKGEIQLGRLATPCRACGGRGFTVEVPCARCQDGKVHEMRPFVLNIPPGVTNGYRMEAQKVHKGKGESNLIVDVSVEESKVFQRTLKDPSDLLLEVPISYSEACVGASIKIPTPSKVIALKVPPSTQSGKAFRITGQGMPRLNGPQGARGDLYARVQIKTPEKLSSQQRKLITQLSHYDPEDVRYQLFRDQ